MSKLWRIFPIVVLLLACVAVPVTVQAQTKPIGMSSQSTDEQTAQGELTKVDTEKHTLVIKSSDESDLEFQYNSETKVEGITNGVQGLSTRTGSRVMVHYKEQAGQKIATRIEILKSAPNR